MAAVSISVKLCNHFIAETIFAHCGKGPDFLRRKDPFFAFSPNPGMILAKEYDVGTLQTGRMCLEAADPTRNPGPGEQA